MNEEEKRKSVRFGSDHRIPARVMEELSSDSDSAKSLDITAEARKNTIYNRQLQEEGVERVGTGRNSGAMAGVAAAAAGNAIGPESLAGGLVPSIRIPDEDGYDPLDEQYRARIAEQERIATANTDTAIPSHEASNDRHEQKAEQDYFGDRVNEALNAYKQNQQSSSHDSTLSAEHTVPLKASEAEEESSRKRMFGLRRRASVASKSSKASKSSSVQSQTGEELAQEMAKNLVEQHTAKWDANKEQTPTFTVTPVPGEDGSSSNEKSEQAEESASDAIVPPNNLETGTSAIPEVTENQPTEEDEYFENTTNSKPGILGSLLKLYNDAGKNLMGTPGTTPATSASTTPALTPVHSPNPSHSGRVSPGLLSPSITKTFEKASKAGRKLVRPPFQRSHSSGSHPKLHKTGNAPLSHLAVHSLGAMAGTPMDFEKRHNEKRSARKKYEAQQRQIAIHIADVLQRQRFLLRFARALMLYGAPSHRLEEFLYQSARIFEIDAQFLYFPGCVIVTFGDQTTHTSETMLLRVAQGINLRKLHLAYLVYKDVVHGVAQVDSASQRIDDLLSSKNQYPTWLLFIFFGLASAFIGMFSFGGGWKELPIIFVLSMGIGILQLYVAPKSTLYSNVFEISSCIFVSFVARALSSIYRHGSPVFCFGAIVQGSISLILPGYIILTGSLELQAKNLVSGSVRMFYAIIYSMFLTFGITLGSAIYGWMDGDASNQTHCDGLTDPKWKILFVPLSAACLALTNHASYRQLPVMVIVASAGYVVLALLQYNISNASIFTSTMGALTIGIFGNLWSRLGHGLAFTTMIPGVLVIVPGGVAAQGSLIAGVDLANSIVRNVTASETDVGSFATLGGSMTQVAVGISVGLFLSTLVVYPLGMKTKSTALFTF